MLRVAGLHDLDLLVLHRRRMWEEMDAYPAGAADPTEPSYRDWLSPKLASGAAVGLVEERDGSRVASGILWFQPWHPRPHIPRGTIPYLLSVFVEPAWRRQGLARAITLAAADRARSDGHPRLSLHCSEAGKAVYEGLGFQAGKEMWLEFS